MISPKIAIFAEKSELQSLAQKLAERLRLPLTHQPEQYDYILQYTDAHLTLQKMHSTLRPFFIDFLSGKLTYRRKQASLRTEALARALGLHNISPPLFTIIDATAGLGRDSFILASLGFHVQLIERSPIIHALLEDGIKRAALDPEVAPITSRLQLIQADAISWLPELIPSPELIYLDPMFPEKQKSAAVKKEMQIFQDLLGTDQDTEILLKTALTCASKRVVVKRPRLAKPIPGAPPSYSLTGSSSRFDIYLK